MSVCIALRILIGPTRTVEILNLHLRFVLPNAAILIYNSGTVETFSIFHFSVLSFSIYFSFSSLLFRFHGLPRMTGRVISGLHAICHLC